MLVSQLIEAMEQIAPARYAESWDNVGLLVGAGVWPADSILLTIDLTEEVLQEALRIKARAVVAYHPLIFAPLKRLTDTDEKSRLALEAASNGIAVYSPHTAIDAAPGGVNDWLAEAFGGGDVRALESHADSPTGERCKIITFCPVDAVGMIRDALASIGAGRIGAYARCSFAARGTGSFEGDPDSDPTVGRPGRLETVDEARLEMVCGERNLALAVATLREVHPYEEPPIDILDLRPRPHRGVGAGRRVHLDRKLGLKAVVTALKDHLGVKHLQVATGRGAPRAYATVGLCAGAGGSLLPGAIDHGCELFLTGEMRHHDVLEAQARGCTVVLAGHTNTERGYLKPLRERLAGALPDCTIAVARQDRDPLVVM